MNKRIKQLPLWFSIGVAVVFLFFISRDSLARLAWEKINRPDLALALLDKDEKFAISLGSYYFNGGAYDLKKAKKAYEKALKSEHDPLWANYQLARVYFVEGDNAKALEYINKELKSNPENLRSLYVRGLIYGYRGQAGDLEKAEADFRRFTGWSPKEWAGYNDLAWILSKQEKYGEAEKALNLAFKEISEAENNPWLWNALGVAELNLKKYPVAANSFKKAKKLAEKLTLKDWQHSYPGNNPASAEEGFSAFIAAIEENLHRVQNYKILNSVD